jgi:hypothetical protein
VPYSAFSAPLREIPKSDPKSSALLRGFASLRETGLKGLLPNWTMIVGKMEVQGA